MDRKKILSFVAVLAFCVLGLWAQSSEFEGKTVVVFEPSFNSEEQADSWIPSFVQGIVSTNFQKYSNMKVIDRQNIDRVIKEQKLSESLSYSEDGQIEIGKLLAAQYIIAINVIKKSNNGYSIEYKITNTETGAIGGSYIDTNCIESDMNDGSAINNDCRELLLAIGINESNLSDLSKANIQKQKAEMLSNEQLARGIAAEKAGNLVEAISFYQKAQNTGFGIAEAVSRLQSTTSTMVSGGIDADVAQIAYDEIAQLNKETDQWIKVWSDFRDLFQKSSVIVVYYYEELPNPKRELGSTIIEYNDIKYSLKCKFEKELYEVYRVIDNAFKSVNKERLAWYFDKSNNRGKLRDFVYSINPIRYRNFSNEAWFEISIVNSNDKTIATYKRDVRIPFDKFLDCYEKNKEDKADAFTINLRVNVADYTNPLTLRVEVHNGICWSFNQLGQIVAENKGILSQSLFRDFVPNYKTITEYTIPDNTTIIDSSVFVGCELLERVVIPDGVVKIDDNAFYGCSKLRTITIPRTIQLIGNDAFYDSSYIEEPFYSHSYREDPLSYRKYNYFHRDHEDAFYYHFSIYYNGTIEDWTQISFVNITSNPLIRWSIKYDSPGLYIGKDVRIKELFTSNGNVSSRPRIELKNNISRIGSYAFFGWNNLTSVTIPETVTEIQSEAFAFCENLQNIIILAKTPPKIYKDTFDKHVKAHLAEVSDGYRLVYPDNTSRGNPTIFVPKESVEKYKQTWKGVVDPKRIKAIR